MVLMMIVTREIHRKNCHRKHDSESKIDPKPNQHYKEVKGRAEVKLYIFQFQHQMDKINQRHNPATPSPGEQHPVIFQYRFDGPLSHFGSGVTTETYSSSYSKSLHCPNYSNHNTRTNMFRVLLSRNKGYMDYFKASFYCWQFTFTLICAYFVICRWHEQKTAQKRGTDTLRTEMCIRDLNTWCHMTRRFHYSTQ